MIDATRLEAIHYVHKTMIPSQNEDTQENERCKAIQ